MKTHALLLSLLLSLAANAQPAPDDIILTDIPTRYQFFPRGEKNSAAIRIAGASFNKRYDSVFVDITQNGDFSERLSAPLLYTNDTADFELSAVIYAALVEYNLSVYVHSPAGDSLIAFRDSIVCGDVYIIDGQSNTVWTGNVGNLYSNEYCRTFGVTASTNPADTLWANSVAVLSATAPNVGSWGLRLQQRIMEEQGVPTCFINGGVGGTMIEAHQRDESNHTNLNTIYGSLLNRVQKAKLTHAAKAMFWYQGESNTAANYYNNFKAMYDDWREDYPNFTKLYLFQVHHGCNAGAPHGEVREILRSIKDSIPNVVQVSVMGINGHDGCHYTLNGYTAIGDMVYKQVARDFYNADDIVAVDPPNILKAFFRDEAHQELVLQFSSVGSSLVLQGDTTVQGITASLKEYFYLDTDTNIVTELTTEGNKLILHLKSPSNAKTVTYLPDTYYDGTGIVYQGPYLFNARRIGALSFRHFPITDSMFVSVHNTKNDGVSISAYPNPFTDKTTIRYSVDKPSDVRIEILDVLGRTVHAFAETVKRSGTHEFPFELDMAGVFFCRITVGDLTKTIRVVSE